jgi:hypothetical protein
MCLRFKFYTHQRVCVPNFLKKGKICCTLMYSAYTYCGLERKLSVHFLPNMMSKNRIICRKTRGQGSGCGHVTGWVNSNLGFGALEDYFESSERLVILKIPCG